MAPSHRDEPGSERLDPAEIRRRALNGLVALTLRSATVRLMNFAGNLVLARLLFPRDFGLLAFGLAIVTVGNFLASGGLGSALIRQERPPEREQLEAVFGIQLLATSVAVALVAAVGVPLGTAGRIAAIMALSLPLDCVRVPYSLVTERTLTYRPIVRAEIAQMVAYNAVAVTSVVLGAGIWGVAVAVVCRALTGTVVLVRLTDMGVVRPRLSIPLIRPLYRFGLTLQGVDLVNLVRDQGLNFCAVALAGTAVLGIASFAMRLVQPIWLLFAAAWRVSFPAISRLIEAGEDAGAFVERGLRLAATLTGLGVVTIGAASPALIPSVFGHKWDATIGVMPLALMSLMFGGPITATGTGWFSAIGDARRVLKSVTIVAATWFVVGVPLIPALGAQGMAVGWCAGGLVDLLYLGSVMQRTGSVRVGRAVALPTTTVVVVGALGWLVAERLGPTLASTFASGALAAVAYVAVVWTFQRGAVVDVVRLARRVLPGRPALAA